MQMVVVDPDPARRAALSCSLGALSIDLTIGAPEDALVHTALETADLVFAHITAIAQTRGRLLHAATLPVLVAFAPTLSPGEVLNALEEGAVAIAGWPLDPVLRSPARILDAAVRRRHRGQIAALEAARRLQQLTPRELEVVFARVAFERAEEGSEVLAISRRTYEVHLANATAKLGLSSQGRLAGLFCALGQFPRADDGDVVTPPAFASQLHELVAVLRRIPRAPGARERGALGPLTRRQEQIVQLLKAGLTQREIAQRLQLSPESVYTHTARARRTFGLKSVRELLTLLER